ncbi:hypothetical protein DAI22_04g039500 [Oryza sativa Japonica Group]|nr:hypothetical protein DAI22_04g039500 [Oryza sativa Japonica Group]
MIPTPAKVSGRPREFSKTATVRVENGHISIDNLTTELRRLVPVRFEVKETAQDTFVVQFPSTIELDRLHRVGRVRSFDFGVDLLFNKWEQEIEAKFVLKKTWFRVYGVPYEIRDFLSLHAVGSVIGNTTMVDMVYLRKHGVVRMQVAVDDLATLPPSVYIVFRNHGYEIFFEPEMPEEESKGKEKLDEDDQRDDSEQKRNDDDVIMEDRNPKRLKNEAASSSMSLRGGSVTDSQLNSHCVSAIAGLLTVVDDSAVEQQAEEVLPTICVASSLETVMNKAPEESSMQIPTTGQNVTLANEEVAALSLAVPDSVAAISEEEFTTTLTDAGEMAPAGCASLSEASTGASTLEGAVTVSLAAPVVMDDAAQEIESDKVGLVAADAPTLSVDATQVLPSSSTGTMDAAPMVNQEVTEVTTSQDSMILDVGTAGVNTVIELAADGAQLDAARTIIAEAKVQAEAGGKRPSQEAKRRSRRLIHPTPTRQSERQKAMANGDAPVANRAEFLKKIHNLEVVAGYLHVFLLAPLLVYNATT